MVACELRKNVERSRKTGAAHVPYANVEGSSLPYWCVDLSYLTIA